MSTANYIKHPHYALQFPADYEAWDDIPGWEGFYMASTWGRVKSLDRRIRNSRGRGTRLMRGKILSCDVGDRPGVGLMAPGRKTEFVSVARLVLLAFVGSCPEGMECCHWDGNPKNNRLENLRWDTDKNNQLDRKRHGTDNSGERNGSAVLTEGEVREIKKLFALRRAEFGIQNRLSEMFGVSPMIISCVIRGKTWRGVE